MTDAARRICDAARQLPVNDRLLLLEQLLESLDVVDCDIDRLWSKEAEDRLAAFRRGEMNAVPLSRVIEKYAAS